MSTGTGISYLWQTSPDGSAWTNVPSATNPTYSPTPAAGTTYYRISTTCSGQTNYSNAVVYNAASCQALNVPATGSSTIACGNSTTLYDSGGAGGNYGINHDGHVVFNNSGTSVITITGTYNTESTYDFVGIYSGAGTSTLIAEYTGAGTIPTFTSAPGQTITVRFDSDDSVSASGFAFNVVYSAGCAQPPACATLTSPANGATNLTTMLLAWDAPTGTPAAVSYDVMIGTAANNLAFVTNVSTTSVNITGWAPNTTYYWTVYPKSADGAVASGCATRSLTTGNPFAPYCSNISYTSAIEPITLVNFAGINRSSSNVVGGSPALENYIADVANVTTESSYNITLKGNTDGNYQTFFSVFIDWNQDGDFGDANEYYPAGSVTGSTGLDAAQAVTSIMVPYHALAGNTRMRVKKLYGSASTTPCDGGGYGQSEDYTVNVTKCGPQLTWYADTDNDGYGNVASSVQACGAPAGYVADSTDCNDTNNLVWQTGTFYVDADGDGYDIGTAVLCYGATTPAGHSATTMGTDCDDNNANAFQSAELFTDADGDGYNVGSVGMVCYGSAVPAGFTLTDIGTDCNDAVATINPGMAEILYNGFDDNCDGNLDEGFQILTSVTPTQCGTTLPSISSLVSATSRPNSTGYRFEVTNTATGAVQVIDRPLQWFSLTMLPQYDYATTYSIRVMVQRNGVWLGYYGPACQVSSPAILDAGGAAQISASQCGITLATINTLIATNSIPNTTGYRFRVTNLTDPSAPNQVQTIDRTLHWFALTMLPTYTYGTTYLIEVAVKTNGDYSGYGSPCTISTPAVPTLTNCGATIATSGTLITTVNKSNTTSYRFEITNLSNNIVTTIDRPNHWFSFNMVPGYAPNTQYGVRVALMTSGVYSLFGDACVITSPGAAREGEVKETIEPFKAVAYPNPFAEGFGIHMTTSAEAPVSIKVYDMTGRLVEATQSEVSALEHVKIGDRYPAGVYNVVVSQGENVSTLRVVKR